MAGAMVPTEGRILGRPCGATPLHPLATQARMWGAETKARPPTPGDSCTNVGSRDRSLRTRLVRLFSGAGGPPSSFADPENLGSIPNPTLGGHL